MLAIVTIKLPYTSFHNPNDKKQGKCPVSKLYCTDITGQHHSFLLEGETIGEIEKMAYKNYSHITRIEVVK